MLIVGAELDGRADWRIRVGERIEAVAADLRARPGEQVYDAAGGAVIAGLHDHHIHLRAVLAARSSVRLDGATSGEEFRAVIRAAHANAEPGEWLRVVGYNERRMGRLDRYGLDQLAGRRPVRVQSSTGELWVLNTAALRAVDVDSLTDPGVERDGAGHATGRLWRLDGRLRRLLGAAAMNRQPPTEQAWRDLSRRATAQGVTGFTDATADRDQDDVDAFSTLVQRGVIAQRLTLMSPVGLHARPGVVLGPHKIVLDDVTLPTPDVLAEVVTAAHRLDTPVAVHCVTLDQLVVALAAIERAGPHPRDRIEHASVVAPAVVPSIRSLGVTVVTQPGFIRARGDDYRREVAAEEQPWLYPCASLIRAGVPVAAGTDAPHADTDPWAAIAAAIDRRTASGVPMGDAERVDAGRALDLFLGAHDQPGRRREVRVGEPGELCILRSPLRDVLADPRAGAVAATIIGGRVRPATAADGDVTPPKL